MPCQRVIFFISSHIQPAVLKTFILAPFTPHPDPSPSQLRWGLSPPESRRLRLPSFLSERQAKSRRQEEDEVKGS